MPGFNVGRREFCHMVPLQAWDVLIHSILPAGNSHFRECLPSLLIAFVVSSSLCLLFFLPAQNKSVSQGGAWVGLFSFLCFCSWEKRGWKGTEGSCRARGHTPILADPTPSPPSHRSGKAFLTMSTFTGIARWLVQGRLFTSCLLNLLFFDKTTWHGNVNFSFFLLSVWNLRMWSCSPTPVWRCEGRCGHRVARRQCQGERGMPWAQERINWLVYVCPHLFLSLKTYPCQWNVWKMHQCCLVLGRCYGHHLGGGGQQIREILCILHFPAPGKTSLEFYTSCDRSRALGAHSCTKTIQEKWKSARSPPSMQDLCCASDTESFRLGRTSKIIDSSC